MIQVPILKRTMTKATSPLSPPSRKADAPRAIPDDAAASRWSDGDLRRVLGFSVAGVVVFGLGWLEGRSNWMFWPAALSAVALQISATMLAVRTAVASRGAGPAGSRGAAELPPVASYAESRWPAVSASTGREYVSLAPTETSSGKPSESQPATEATSPRFQSPCPRPHDAALHGAFFRRIVDAEFTEHAAGMVWPDLGAVQGSLATRLLLFRRHPSSAPVRESEISAHERTEHSPWHHLAALETVDYRRGDALARLAHRAFAPLAFLELHVRLDVSSAERIALDEELDRFYRHGFGRVLTPPALLSAVEPLRQRMGGREAIALADEARHAVRGAGTLRDAEQERAGWRVHARGAQESLNWPGDVFSIVEALVDYWFVQRAAAEDMAWADALVRLEGGTRGAALAQRDATGAFHFAEALTLVMGASRAAYIEPTVAATTA